MGTRTNQPSGTGDQAKKPATRKAAPKTAAKPRGNAAGRSTPALGKGLTRAGRQLEAAERAKKALNLRTMRVSWDNVAKQCGYSSRGAAYTAVQRELRRIPREAARELRTSELEMLDRAQQAISAQVLAGSYGAIDRLLKIMDARAKLTGLHEDIADTGVDEVKDVLAAWMGQVRKQVDLDDAMEGGDDDDLDDEAVS